MQLILFTGLIATVASLALVAVLPSAGIDYKNATVGFEGIYPQKNICSVITVMLLTPAFFYRFTGSSASVKRIGYFVLLIALIIGTRARTGWIVLALVVLFIVLSKFLHRLRPLERVLVTAFLPAVGLLASYLIYDSRFAILKFLGKDPSLSGRTGIWAVMFLAIVKRPLTGFGYAAFWTVTNPEAHRLALAAADPGLNNAENGILQLWLEIGLIGVLILGYLLFRTTKNAITCFRSDTPNYALWYMSILFITLLGLGDGSKFMVPTSIEWVLYILCDIGLAREAQRVRSARTTWA
jgi:O-antigen ligase